MSRGVRFDARLAKTQTFDPDDDEEPMVRRSTTLAEKRAIYSHTRALLAKIRFQRPLGDERPGDANDANDEKDQETSGTLNQSAVQHWGKVQSQNSRARTNWKKLREFVGATKKVRKCQDVMQIWLQVHQENTQRKLLEALTEFIQSEALRAAEAAEAAELFRAAEAAAAAAAEAKARKEAEEAARAAEREKREIFDIHAFSKQAANMMESLAQMQKEQDQLLREVEELQANMNLSSRRAGRLVEKIQETDMAATVNAIRNLAAQIPESDEEEEQGLEEEEEEVSEEPGAPDAEAVETVPSEQEKMVTFEEKREELIEKVVEIEWLLLKSRKIQNSQANFAQEMKESLCPLLPRMRPRCDFGHLMNEAPGRCPTAVRSEDACCSCGVIFGQSSRSQASTSPSPSLTLPGTLGDPKAAPAPATHWVCQDCLFQSHVASWMCYDCSLEHQKTEMGRVAASLEAKAERSHEAELQAIVDTIDPSIRAEAQRRLRLRRGSELMEQVVEATNSNSKRPQFVRKEKPKPKRAQVARRNSQRMSLIMKPLDLGDKFLAETVETETKDSPKERSPVQLAKAPSPELGEVTKITVEGVVLERALGIKPDKEIISSSQLRSRRNQLALEASEIAKRLAQRESREAESCQSLCPSCELRPNSSSATQRRVERATLVAWKERVDAAEGSPHPGCIPDALRSPSPRPMISPVERFSPGPLDSPNRRQRVRTRPFEISSRPNAARLSLRPWRHGGADTLEPFDEVVAQHRPNTAPTQVTKSAKIRSVEQWLKVLMPVEKDGVSDEAEARQNESHDARKTTR